MLNQLAPNRNEKAAVVNALMVRALGPLLDAHAEDALARQLAAALATLRPLDAASIAEHASPFFMLNVRRLHKLLDGDRWGAAETGPFAAYAAATLFDSFFSGLADGTAVALELPETAAALERPITLPNLGLRIPAPGRRLRLERRSATHIAVETESRGQEVIAIATPDAFAAPTAAIPGSTIRVVATPGEDLFDQQHLDQLIEGVNTYPAFVGAALALIRSCDPALCAEIERHVKWFVPIDSPSNDTQSSFSASNLDGVIFMSETGDSIRAAEAIVHEYGHSQLNRAYSEADIARSPSGEIYYSPWRPDPRPLMGLLHAVYVFLQVNRFLVAVQARGSATLEQRTYIAERRILLSHRLRLGLAQIDTGVLTRTGRKLVAALRGAIAAETVDVRRRRPPELILRHVESWLVRNANVAGGLKVSAAIRRRLHHAAGA